ncbi:1-(5-phosphoribosyl)-5-[(5-phosphoribosylamino) methylideneamino] imidazole-4-carboxamide isomerase [Christensenellaceae bacterium]|nr:1-(5-phosphoribosyl)-5-[(5-phosphoribosylamino) methylideneamino] imidazole-4-carboxamide isomerase [Christensenellaceae bacterium]BDF60983.1 1-(5-phosphoribosyl)-5-[(5-phosphoribosylamino) methylideneamino] imidazole-4-carboxamide isomerase [Christensenellaceae bacterium]
MKIYPAIDIKNGKCVRLKQGVMDSSTEYGDPMEMARKWAEKGAYYLHVVDLDAAFAGEFVNRDMITKIVQSLKIPVQVGGGIRTREDIRIRLDEVGISRVILGTVAVEDPELVQWAVSKYKDRIAVGIDAKDGKVAIKGWADKTDIDAVELAQQMRKLGVRTIIYTDISKDGMMKGPDVENTEKIVKKTWVNLIASGGISSIDDLQRIKGTGACGCIIGKALYDNAFTLEEALKAAK